MTAEPACTCPLPDLSKPGTWSIPVDPNCPRHGARCTCPDIDVWDNREAGLEPVDPKCPRHGEPFKVRWGNYDPDDALDAMLASCKRMNEFETMEVVPRGQLANEAARLGVLVVELAEWLADGGRPPKGRKR